MPLDRFQEMQIFTRIVDRRSFTQAAEDLNLPRATVTNSIKRLEARLGVRLLHRTTRRLSLTEEGEVFHLRCIEVLGSVDVTTGYFTVQVGAFHDRGNAERLRERLSASYSPIFIQQYDSPDGTFYRVRVGKISGEDSARGFGEQLRSKEGFAPFVVRLDEPAASGAH